MLEQFLGTKTLLTCRKARGKGELEERLDVTLL